MGPRVLIYQSQKSVGADSRSVGPRTLINHRIVGAGQMKGGDKLYLKASSTGYLPYTVRKHHDHGHFMTKGLLELWLQRDK